MHRMSEALIKVLVFCHICQSFSKTEIGIVLNINACTLYNVQSPQLLQTHKKSTTYKGKMPSVYRYTTFSGLVEATNNQVAVPLTTT